MILLVLIMINELIQLTAIEAVSKLNSGDISPLEMISAAEARIMEVEPLINALPTLCFERAREHASLLMAGKNRNNNKPGWLAGLPVAIKDLTDVEGVRTTYGSPIYASIGQKNRRYGWDCDSQVKYSRVWCWWFNL